MRLFYDSCCCVCLGKDALVKITGNESKNPFLLEQLQEAVVEIQWDINFKICNACIENLKNVIEFRKQCFESENIRNKQIEHTEDVDKAETQDEESNLHDFDNGFDPDINEEEEDMKITENKPKTEYIYITSDLGEKDPNSDNYNIKNEENAVNFICEQCDSKFSTVFDFEKHLQVHGNVFICFHCQKQCTSKAALITHIQMTHDKNKTRNCQCDRCFVIFDSLDCLERHFKEEHEHEKPGIKKFFCSKCLRGYTLKKTMMRHFLKCDGVRRHSKITSTKDCSKNKCTNCNRYYTTSKILKAHLKTCNGRKKKQNSALNLNKAENWSCSICKAEFELQNERDKHVENEHLINLESVTVCKECYINFDSLEECQKHFAETHSNNQDKELSNTLSKKAKQAERSYNCEVCSQVFGFVKDLLEHCINKHSMDSKLIKPFQCDQCSMRFTSSANLNQHRHYHAGERNHICSFCGKSFKTKGDLTVHERTHFNKRNYKCEICNKGYNTNKNLRSHKLVVHTSSDLWKYACHLCDRKFPIKSGYDQHLKRHSGDKQFECHICQKQFVSRSEAAKHMSIHSNVRAFKCKLCQKEYKDKRMYQVHLAREHNIGNAKIPKREKKFACHICPNIFMDRQKLTRHLCTHTGIRPYMCSLCSKKFSDKSYYKHHLKVAHNVLEMPPESLVIVDVYQ